MSHTENDVDAAPSLMREDRPEKKVVIAGFNSGFDDNAAADIGFST